MHTIHTQMVATINGVNRIFTLLKSTESKTLYEVECLGMFWYEIHFTSHDRINREYNYLKALIQWNN
jgi:hypothetical protein